MPTDRLNLAPVNWDENVRVMRELKELLKSSMTPEGCPKAMVTGGDILQVAVTCSSLIARLEPEHPVCKYIMHVASGLPDFGLYFAVMVCHLVELLWCDGTLSKQKQSSAVSFLLDFIQEKLKSDLVCLTVDFNSINSFVPLVRTVISSKCPTFLFDLDIECFCIELVKTFLSCLDETTNTFGRAYVKVETGTYMCCCKKGLLYKITEEKHLKNIEALSGQIKTLVFTTKLDHSNNSSDFVVNKVMPILDKAVELKIRIIACQKTVAPEIKLHLIRQNVILLDRMGTDLTDLLLYTSQALPVSYVDSADLDVSKHIGTLTAVKLVQFNESNYILLRNQNASVATLLIQNYWLGGTDHLKEMTYKTLSALRSLALHPTLTFGGGCLEIWLIAQLHIMNESHKDAELRKLSHWVQHALLSACGRNAPSSIDSAYHHAWSEGGTKCRCGVVTLELLEAEAYLIPLVELVNTHSSGQVTLTSPRQTTATIPSHVLVDAHNQKSNVILSAIETFVNLSDIGFIVYEQ